MFSDALIEASGTDAITLQDALARAQMRGEAMQAHAGQDGQFGEMENAIGISEKDDDLVAIFFRQTQAPASRALASQQRGTQAGRGLRLGRRGRSLLSLPQAEGATQRHDQQGKMAMHDDGGRGFLGEMA